MGSPTNQSKTYAEEMKIRAWIKDPTLFVWDVWGVSPWEDQVAPMRAFAQTGSRVSVRAGNGTGKTSMIPWLIFWALSCFGTNSKPAVGIIGHASGDQLKTSIWSALRVWHERMKDGMRNRFVVKDKLVQRVDCPSAAYFVGRTADKQEAMQGLRGYFTFYILDESSGIEDEIFEAAQSACTGAYTFFMAAGNPLRTDGWFKKTQTDWRGAPWQAFKMDYFKCPFSSLKWAKDVLQQYGEKSQYYIARVLGEFPEASSDILIPLAWMEAACSRDLKPGSPRILGIDPAGMGDDTTGFVEREGAVVTSIEEFDKQDEMQIVGRAFSLYMHRKYDRIVVDAIGIGAGIASRLLEMGAPVIRVNVAEAVSQYANCSRMRDEIWWRTREQLYNKTVSISNAIPKHMVEKLKAQMSTVRYGFKNGKIKVESKDQMRDRGVQSPNLADAFNLTAVQGYVPELGNSMSRQPIIVPSNFPYV